MIAPRPNRFVLTSVVALLAGAALAVAPCDAWADPSCTPECSKGFTCQVSGIGGCPASPLCPAGTACSAPPPCENTILYACQPAPCTTDDDCAAGMVCHADTYETCGASSTAEACAKGDECEVAVPPPDAGSCTTAAAQAMCVPRYDLPCTVDSDCGDGFTCVPETATTCSGGGSAGDASAGELLVGSGVPSAPSPAVDAGATESSAPDAEASPIVCATTTLSTSECQVNPIPCSTASDCPATWTCAPQPEAVSNVACAAHAELIDGSAVAPACDAGSALSGPMMCQPPYPVVASENGGAALSGPSNGSDAPGAVGGGAGTSAAPTASPAAPGGNGEQGSAGCQMGSSPAGAASGWFAALLGLAGILVQRRLARRGAAARR